MSKLMKTIFQKSSSTVLHRIRLRTRMLVMILGINAVALTVVFLTYYRFASKAIVLESQSKSKEAVKSVVATWEGFINEKTGVAKTFCNHPQIKRWLAKNSVRNPDKTTDSTYADIVKYMLDIMEEDDDITFAFLGSDKTQMYYEPTERPLPDDYRIGTRPWYMKAKSSLKHFVQAEADIYYGQLFCSPIFPIMDEDGGFLGVGGVDIEVKNMDRFLSDLDLFENAFGFIVDETGKFMYHPVKEWVFKKSFSDFPDNDQFKNIAGFLKKSKSNLSGIESVMFEGESHFYVYHQIPNLGWTLILSVSANEMNAPMISLARTSILLAFGISSILVLAILLITGTVTKPIEKIVKMLHNIAEGEGDLTKRLQIDSNDEVGELARWFNRFVSKLHDIILQVRTNTETVAAASCEISATSAELASGAEEQDVQTSEVATSVQQMTSAIVENSRNAARSAEIAQEASSKAADGSDAMKATLEGMEEIVMSTAKTGDIVKTLAGRTGQIDDIIQVINDIADQTNLLALNAAIEAARAGEQGRGFAVVADEVRKLAERTTKATHEISKTIEAIQQDTNEASTSMDAVRDVVNQGKEMAFRTDSVLRTIIESVNGAMDMIGQIAAASEQMSQGAEEISRNIESISIVTRESATGAEQMAGTADRMTHQTAVLKNLVNRFRLNKNNIAQQNNRVEYPSDVKKDIPSHLTVTETVQ